jgi:hypothetical protein
VASAGAKGLITDNRTEPSGITALTFAPVEVAAEPPTTDTAEEVRSARRRKATRAPGTVEIEFKSGDRVRVAGCADAGLVVRIVAALRRA